MVGSVVAEIIKMRRVFQASKGLDPRNGYLAPRSDQTCVRYPKVLFLLLKFLCLRAGTPIFPENANKKSPEVQYMYYR